MRIVRIDTRLITDWETFDDVFVEAFLFPDYYGRNAAAWIDCMSDIENLTVIQLDHVGDFEKRCPEQYQRLLKDTAFVNWRKIEAGDVPVLVLSFDGSGVRLKPR